MWKLAICSSFVLMLLNPEKIQAQTKKPNIIFILGDDIGYKTLTVNGGKSYSTPNLDSMALHGMNFSQCHSAPLCSPSRFMLLTGKYNFRNYTQWGLMDLNQKTFGNLFKDAGYATACFGKWQFGGGDAAIHAFGFDSYCVLNPFADSEDVRRYKSPSIYTNGKYVSYDSVINQYSEDIFTDSVINFMNRNKDTSFFIYYPMALAHPPFKPTPGTPDYYNQKPGSDTAYYPSMISYMDKKIGEIIKKVKRAGIENNTIIIYAGDNGTPSTISQIVDDDSTIFGGKKQTKESGTHVPLIVYWKGTIRPASVNNDLIDFTDFLPTFAGLAGITVTAAYGTIDGVSFAPRLQTEAGTPRQWIFNYYDPYPGQSITRRWAQTFQYKLYDTSALNNTRLFYNIIDDPDEAHPLVDDSLTQREKTIKRQLLDVIQQYILQGLPILNNPEIIDVADSLTIIKDTIQINGGSTIKASGVVWGTEHNPDLTGGNFTADNNTGGSFYSLIPHLNGNTTYYVKTYATNAAGTSYSNEISFTTPPAAPVCTNATQVNNSGFTANWQASQNAANYKIDVSILPEFSAAVADSIVEGFDSGKIAANWNSNKKIITDTDFYARASPSFEFYASNQTITTPVLPGAAKQLRFWINGLRDSAGSLLVEGFDGLIWRPLDNITNILKMRSVKKYTADSSAGWRNNFIQFRFTYSRSYGNILFDDIDIKYNINTPSFVAGYEDLTVLTDSLPVTSLEKNTRYYYRVRVQNANGTSANSNTIDVTTCMPPTILNLKATNPLCRGSKTGAIDITTSDTGFVYKWSGPGNFSSATQNINKLYKGIYYVDITAAGVCKTDTSITLTEPAPLTLNLSADSIICNTDSTNITVTATGGTGDYTYSLSDGIKIIGPQTENYFEVAGGNYTVSVEDSNHCMLSKIISIKTKKCDTLPRPGKLIVTVFPNPANEFNLITSTGSDKKIHFIVHDVYGKKVFESVIEGNTKYIFGKSFASGVYFVHVMQGNIEKTFKIVKLNR